MEVPWGCRTEVYFTRKGTRVVIVGVSGRSPYSPGRVRRGVRGRRPDVL